MWPFRPRKPPPLPIPKFHVEPKVEPKPEPIEVIEVIDPTQTMVDRFKELIKKRLKTGD